MAGTSSSGFHFLPDGALGCIERGTKIPCIREEAERKRLKI